MNKEQNIKVTTSHTSPLPHREGPGVGLESPHHTSPLPHREGSGESLLPHREGPGVGLESFTFHRYGV